MVLSPEICRAGRGWLGWSQQHLAASAGVAINTIREFEAGRRRINQHSMRNITLAFSRNGLKFLWYDGNPVGIYLG
jgi:ribosome-binding protein aMBF1 (putative translation factor)